MGQTSVYGQSHRSAYTPAYNMGFSPNENALGSPANFYASPTHYHASPDYGSPAGSSPIYAAAGLMGQSPTYIGASPIYNPQMSRANYAGANNVQSPKYSPSSIQSPKYPGAQQPYSPIYNQQLGGLKSGLGNAGKSPGYSPSSNLRGAMGVTPGQGAGSIQQSPAYSPTSLGGVNKGANTGGTSAYNQMMGISPVSAPAGALGGMTPTRNLPISSPDIAGGFTGAQPGITPSPGPAGQIRGGNSPAYNPISPSYQGAALGTSGYSPPTPNPTPSGPDNPKSIYEPLSPAYNPSQPKKD